MRTHTHIYIDTHTSCTMQTHKVEKQSRHRQRSKGMAQQGTRKVNQTLPYPRNATQARYWKDKGYIPTTIGYGPTSGGSRIIFLGGSLMS